MSYVDRIDLSIPSEEILSILSLFASAQEKLELLPQVGPQERKHLAKLGLKNEALALQIIEVGRLNPDLIPRGIDFELIDRDRVAREQLRALKLVLERLLGRVTDAMLLTGVDLYAAALSIYHCLRRNARTAELRESVAELKRGFARPSRKRKEKQEQSASAATPDPKPTPKPEELPASSQSKPVTPAPVPITAHPSNPSSASSEQPVSLPTPSVSLKPQSSPNASSHFAFHLLPAFFSGGFSPVQLEPLYGTPSIDHQPSTRTAR